jgi:hypothetical protein
MEISPYDLDKARITWRLKKNGDYLTGMVQWPESPDDPMRLHCAHD